MWVIWLILTLAFAIAEAVTVSVISVWFAVGAFAAMLVSFIPNVALWVELLVFVLVSAITLIISHRFFLKRLKREHIPTNFDLLIGKTAVMLNDTRAEIEGLSWAVKEVDGADLAVNDKVEVLSIQGVKLIVKKI